MLTGINPATTRVITPRELQLKHSDTTCGQSHLVTAEAGRTQCLACHSALELVYSYDALDISSRLQCRDQHPRRSGEARSNERSETGQVHHPRSSGTTRPIPGVFRHVDGTDCFRQSNVMRAPHANAVEAVAATLAIINPAASFFVEHRITTSAGTAPTQTTRSVTSPDTTGTSGAGGGAGSPAASRSVGFESRRSRDSGWGTSEQSVVRPDGGRANAVLTTDLAFHAPRSGFRLAVEVFDESSYLSLYRRVSQLFAAGYAVMLVFTAEGKYNPDRVEMHLNACRDESRDASGDVDVPIRVGRYRDTDYTVSLGSVITPGLFDPEWLCTADIPAYMI